MNILHVVNISFVIPYFLGSQLLFFKNKGYSEYIVCSPSDELKYFSEQYGFKYKEIDILRKISLLKDLKAIVLSAEYIRKNQINIVIGHTPKGALIAMLAAYIMRVRIRIYFRHGLVYETSLGFKRKMLMVIDKLAAFLATQVVCVSPSVCEKSLEDRLNPASKQCLLSKGTCNGIDTIRFCKESLDIRRLIELKVKLGFKQDCLVIGFTGRLVQDKGIIELICAFKVLQNKYPNLILLLVGMLEERDALPRDIVTYIKENEHIVNTGYIENVNIEYYYALMDVFVLPSYREGFPTSVLEASAMNLPIVTTRVTGCIDSIIEGETGIFVQNDANDLAKGIDIFLQDKAKRHLYGAKGRKFVIENFEQNIIWKEIEKLYH